MLESVVAGKLNRLKHIFVLMGGDCFRDKCWAVVRCYGDWCFIRLTLNRKIG